jgi:hypothetical protein
MGYAEAENWSHDQTSTLLNESGNDAQRVERQRELKARWRLKLGTLFRPRALPQMMWLEYGHMCVLWEMKSMFRCTMVMYIQIC